MDSAKNQIKIGGIQNRLNVARYQRGLVVGLKTQENGAQSAILRLAHIIEIRGQFRHGHANGRKRIVGEGNVLGAGNLLNTPRDGGLGIINRSATGVATQMSMRVIIGWNRCAH